MFLGTLLSSCDPEVAKQADGPTSAQKADSVSTILPDKASAEKISLKEASLSTTSLMNEKRLLDSRLLSDQEKIRLSIKDIDSIAPGSGFRYHVLDTLFSGATVNIFLIAREYPEENIAWMAVYDRNLRLVDHLKVYYENSEGSIMVESAIKNNTVSVTTFNEYAKSDQDRTTTKKYLLDQNSKIVPVL